jgi:ketosteroid isomerase-like protein
MSSENVEIIRRLQELMVSSFGREEELDGAPAEGWDPVWELLAPDISVPVSPHLPHGGDWVGHKGYRDLIEQVATWRRTIGGPELTYLDMEDDHVLLVIEFEGQSVKTGRTYPVRMVELYKLRDGKITELIPYYWDATPMADAEHEEEAS